MTDVSRGTWRVVAAALGVLAASCTQVAESDVAPPDVELAEASTDLGGDGENDQPTADAPADVPIPDAPAPGDLPPGDGTSAELGPPCPNGNDDCLSGYCIEGKDGPVCTKLCLDDCPSGWQCKEVVTHGQDAVFLCVPEHLSLCRPCGDADTCEAGGLRVGGVCRSFGHVGSFCVTPCGDQRPCPDGYECRPDGDESSYCWPQAGTCECDGFARKHALSTTCVEFGADGACPGVRACGAEGLAECSSEFPQGPSCVDWNAEPGTAVPDVDGDGTPDCQDVDKDGDGAVGLSDCDDCDDSVHPDAAEKCNGKDDDCDGATDELDAVGCKVLYRDGDADGFGVEEDSVCACGPTGLYTASVVGDCNDAQAAAFPGAVESCDGADNDCDGVTDPAGSQGCEPYYLDADGDDFGAAAQWRCQCGPDGLYDTTTSGDCNDNDQTRYPGAPETCNGLDDDCDGATDERPNLPPTCPATCAGDPVCAETCALVQPCLNACGSGLRLCVDGQLGACSAPAEYVCLDPTNGCAEFTTCGPCPALPEDGCGGGDEDCDGVEDEDYVGQSTTCGLGACAAGGTLTCESGLVVDTCAPADGNVAPETCDGTDNDCDGQTDGGDPDLERPACELTEGVCAGSLKTAKLCEAGVWASCAAGDYLAVADSYEADDEVACDGADNDCDGETDEELGETNCGVGACEKTISNCVDGAAQSCDPLAGAEVEVCDAVDNDCDGATDEELGETTCGVGACQKTVANCVDGVAASCDPDSGATAEGCDGADNDCDGATDEDLGETSCGVGACAKTVANCVDGISQVCDPALGAQVETCDGTDNDCDGATDEELGETTCGLGVCVVTVANCMGGVAQTCEPADLAVAESCDAQDNDCDGQTDEDLGETTCGDGQCTKAIANCVAGVAQVCDAMAGASEETCDGADNDCDGLTDEDLGETTCGIGLCTHTVPNCADGVAQTCDPLAGATAEVCDGADNDCDGLSDEALGQVSCGVGQCAKAVPACVGGVVQTCDAAAGATTEVCDGSDNDCDGLTDEDLGETTCGDGQCTKTVANCAGGVAQTCDPLAGATADVCDGADNDCDGETDEDLGDTTCGVGQCVNTVANCVDGTPQTCDAMAGATTDVCDGADNDCDGQTDEDLGDTTCGSGQCVKTVANCVGGAVQTCDAMAGATTDVCDGADNDCDGQTDEDLGDTTCGIGQCTKTVANCAGGTPQTCDAMAGATTDVCDGADNDCDGQTDEALGTTPCGVGQCAKTVANCVGGTPQTCDAMAGATTEACDGVDNDCDGQTDENNPGGGGACAVPGRSGECAIGVLQCTSGTLTCQQTYFGGQEICDSKDNDCDGQTDENNPGGGLPCSVPGQQGPCAQGISSCQFGSVTCQQQVFGSSEQCNGQDDDCDGQTDEGNPGGGASCSVPGQQGVCAQGVRQCSGGNLACQQQNWGGVETCDGQDNDCDGQTDENLTQSCNNGCNWGTQTCSFGSWGSCNAAPPQCTSGSCCDGCNYRSSSYQCSSTAYDTDYRCSSSSGCGGQAQRKRQYRYCTGNSTSCGTGNLQWESSWTTLDTCSSSERCSAGSSSASCLSCSSNQTCQNGSCVATSYCNDGTCDGSETPVTCPQDCGPAHISLLPDLYYSTSQSSAPYLSCTSTSSQDWHYGNGTTLPYWVWASNCGVPSTSNPTNYSGYSARWEFEIKKTGIYKIDANIPNACGFASSKYSNDVHYILKMKTASSGARADRDQRAAKGGPLDVFSSVALYPGDYVLYLYDDAGGGCACNGSGCSTVSIRVFASGVGVQFLY